MMITKEDLVKGACFVENKDYPLDHRYYFLIKETNSVGCQFVHVFVDSGTVDQSLWYPYETMIKHITTYWTKCDEKEFKIGFLAALNKNMPFEVMIKEQ